LSLIPNDREWPDGIQNYTNTRIACGLSAVY